MSSAADTPFSPDEAAADPLEISLLRLFLTSELMLW